MSNSETFILETQKKIGLITVIFLLLLRVYDVRSSKELAGFSGNLNFNLFMESNIKSVNLMTNYILSKDMAVMISKPLTI